MQSDRSVGLLTISFLCYLAANAFLTRYVDPTGIFGVLVAAPIWFAFRLWGRRGGVYMAAGGVVLNFVVFVTLGNGLDAFRNHAADMAARVGLEIVAFAALLVIVDRIEAARSELRASRLREKHSTELLTETERKYQTLIELAPEAILVTVDSKVVYSNARLFEMSGYSTDEVIGASFLDFIMEEDRPTAKERTLARLSGQFPGPTTVRYRRKNGEIRWIEVVGGQTKWEAESALMYLVTDVTERKRLEQELIQAQKMEAIGRLSGGIAHDFNNVLQVVLGYTEFIKTKMDDKEVIAKAVASIRAASDKAASMTRQLLAFGRKQVLEPELVILPAFLRQMVSVLHPLLRGDISVVLESEPDDIEVMVDPGRLEQVIMNLALNARDAMPEGGLLKFAVRRVEQVDCPACIEIVVSDTGTGMEEEVLAHAFEPFFTTKEQGRGTGLGLANVHDFVERMGGHVHVDSKKGIGTTFRLYLPEYSGKAAPKKEPRPAIHVKASQFGEVLLVEEDQEVRTLMRDVLSDAGFTVWAAASGREAVHIAHGERGIGILITDFVLSGMSGTQTAEKVREELGGIKVIFMSGRADRVSAGSTKAFAVLWKPFSTEEFLRKVSEALGEPRT